ncbi:MAG: hypothetical protein HQ547_00815 [Candidatus Omnitrophica bacterium]|nr:hypothetical protein [Candidatus Omnitrophota bacterium]
MKNNGDIRKKLSRVITFLTREEMDFIDKLSKDSLFSTGTKLPRTKIIEAMVDVCMRTGVDAKKVGSKEELMDKIFEAIAREALREGQFRIAKK